jgi:hypothetical protein
MAELNFIKGTIKGRLGVLVGSSWRGIPYIKTFTPPGNPRTVDQVAVRTVFRETAHIAKLLYNDILKPYTFPKPQKHTAYNHMIKINRAMFVDKIFDYSKLKIFDGPLPGAKFFDKVLEVSDPGTTYESVLVIHVPEGSEDESDDIVIVILYDESIGRAFCGFSNKRSDNVRFQTKLGIPLDVTKLHLYLVCVRPPNEGTGEPGLVSNTTYCDDLKVMSKATDETQAQQESEPTG